MKIEMMKLWATGLSLACAYGFSACVDSHVDPLVEVHLAASVAGPSSGAWAVCQPPEGTDILPTVCPDPGPNGEERACSVASTIEKQDDGSTWCDVAALCVYECTADADCPTPATGNVVPVCNYVCSLPCDETSVCPDGMTCWHEPHGPGFTDPQGVCMYKYACD